MESKNFNIYLDPLSGDLAVTNETTQHITNVLKQGAERASLDDVALIVVLQAGSKDMRSNCQIAAARLARGESQLDKKICRIAVPVSDYAMDLAAIKDQDTQLTEACLTVAMRSPDIQEMAQVLLAHFEQNFHPLQ